MDNLHQEGPFSTRPVANIELAPGKFFDRNNLLLAGQLLKRCTPLLGYIISPAEVRANIRDQVGQEELDTELSVFQFLLHKCRYTPGEWKSIATVAGFSWKDIDLLVSYDLNRRLPSEGTLIYYGVHLPRNDN